MDYKEVIQEMVGQVKLLEEEFKRVTDQIQQCKTTQQHIGELVLKISHVGLIPINDYGFMHGKLKHTNELLVHLGDDYFTETSAHNAIAILNRRIKLLQERKDKLQEQNIDYRLKIKQAVIQQQENQEVDIIEPLEEPLNESLEDNNPKVINKKEVVKISNKDQIEIKEHKEAFIPIVMEHKEKKEEVQEKPKKISKFMQQFHK